MYNQNIKSFCEFCFGALKPLVFQSEAEDEQSDKLLRISSFWAVLDCHNHLPQRVFCFTIKA